MPFTTAAKPLISRVSSATATENAEARIISRPRNTARSSSPPQCTVNPKPTSTASTTASNTNIISMLARIGPVRIADRLPGGPPQPLDDAALQLEDRAETGRHAGGERQQRQDAGQEFVKHHGARLAGQPLQQRREQSEVQDRGR